MNREYYIKKVQNLTNEPNDFEYLSYAVLIAQIDNNIADDVRSSSIGGWQNGMTIDETFYNENVVSENKPSWTDVNAVISELKTAYADRETAKQAIKADKASGNQKLLDLGLTQAEATALTGYTPPSED